MLRFLLILIVFAVATYFLVRAFQQRGMLPETTPAPKRPRILRQPPKMVAPDDDEDFLRDLDRKRLRPEQGEASDAPDSAEPSDTAEAADGAEGQPDAPEADPSEAADPDGAEDNSSSSSDKPEQG